MSDGVVETAKTGLKGKIGPVPVWLIAAGIGITAVGGYYVYSRKANGAADTTAGTADTTAGTSGIAVGTAEDGTVDSTYTTAGYNTANDSSTATTTTATVAAPSTNATWLVSASTGVVSATSGSYLDVFAALTRYINGDTLSATQKSYVDKAIALEGYPPEGLNGLSTVTPDVTAAPTPSPSPTTPVAAAPASGTPVVSKTPVIGYGQTQAGVYYAIHSLYPFNGSPVSEKTAKANGIRFRLSYSGDVLGGDGTTYEKTKNNPAIYAAYNGHTYHLSQSQWDWLGKPTAKVVSKV